MRLEAGFRYLEVDCVDEDQDCVGVQRSGRQCVLDQILRLVGDPVVDGDPGLIRVLLQHRTDRISLRTLSDPCDEVDSCWVTLP